MNPAWLHQGEQLLDPGDYTKVVTRIQKNCDVCSMRGTAYRCARGCDYDVCQSCGWEVNKAVLSTPDLAPGLDALRRLAEDRGALEALGVGAYDGQQLRAVCRSGRVGPQLEALPPVEVVLTEPQRQKAEAAEAAEAAWLLAVRRLKLASGITCLLVFWISQVARFDYFVALLVYLVYFVSLSCLLCVSFGNYEVMRIEYEEMRDAE
jgi:hypothetical protein